MQLYTYSKKCNYHWHSVNRDQHNTGQQEIFLEHISSQSVVHAFHKSKTPLGRSVRSKLSSKYEDDIIFLIVLINCNSVAKPVVG